MITRMICQGQKKITVAFGIKGQGHLGPSLNDNYTSFLPTLFKLHRMIGHGQEMITDALGVSMLKVKVIVTLNEN